MSASLSTPSPQWQISHKRGKSHLLRPSTILVRCSLVCLLAVSIMAVLVGPLHAHEVVILKSANIAPYNRAISGFKSSMPSDTAFVEYDLKGDAEAGRKYAGKIRASGADLVLAVGAKAAIAARLELFDIPIIYSMVLHPAKYDLNASNIAGVSANIPIGQQLSHLRTVMPNLKRIGYLYDPTTTLTIGASMLKLKLINTSGLCCSPPVRPSV